MRRPDLDEYGEPATDDVTRPASFLDTGATPSETTRACEVRVGAGACRPECSLCTNPCAEGYEPLSFRLCEGCHADADAVAGPGAKIHWAS